MTDQPIPPSGSRWEPTTTPGTAVPAAAVPTTPVPAAAPAAPAGGRRDRLRGRVTGRPGRPRGRAALVAGVLALSLLSGLGGFAIGLAADGPATPVVTTGATTGSGAGTDEDGLPGQPPGFGGGRGGGPPPGHGGGSGAGTLPDGSLPDDTLPDGTGDGGADQGSVTGDPA